ncbi:MAG: bifunctional 4-hydroxy-2-oxoglutarate aldolase/2-dehydro-3-deoxy-phosphogluconate aldolase [Parvularculaceae bacterium]
MNFEDIPQGSKVIPVLELPSLDQAAPLAEALASGGLRAIELTLRTECALDAVGVMQAAAPDLFVGMGTIRNSEDIAKSIDSGASFLVSPGSNPNLLEELEKSGANALPGVATASESMIAANAGFMRQKFFPAEPAGGVNYLKALAGPMPDVAFCPTGGITYELTSGYLALSNVLCVGGSWIATKKMIANCEWKTIEENARRASNLN